MPTTYATPDEAYAAIDGGLRERIETDDELAMNLAALPDEDLADVKTQWQAKQREDIQIDTGRTRLVDAAKPGIIKTINRVGATMIGGGLIVARSKEVPITRQLEAPEVEADWQALTNGDIGLEDLSADEAKNLQAIAIKQEPELAELLKTDPTYLKAYARARQEYTDWVKTDGYYDTPMNERDRGFLPEAARKFMGTVLAPGFAAKQWAQRLDRVEFGNPDGLSPSEIRERAEEAAIADMMPQIMGVRTFDERMRSSEPGLSELITGQGEDQSQRLTFSEKAGGVVGELASYVAATPNKLAFDIGMKGGASAAAKAGLKGWQARLATYGAGGAALGVKNTLETPAPSSQNESLGEFAGRLTATTAKDAAIGAAFGEVLHHTLAGLGYAWSKSLGRDTPLMRTVQQGEAQQFTDHFFKVAQRVEQGTANASERASFNSFSQWAQKQKIDLEALKRGEIGMQYRKLVPREWTEQFPMLRRALPDSVERVNPRGTTPPRDMIPESSRPTGQVPPRPEPKPGQPVEGLALPGVIAKPPASSPAVQGAATAGAQTVSPKGGSDLSPENPALQSPTQQGSSGDVDIEPTSAETGYQYKPRNIVEGFMSPKFTYKVANTPDIPSSHTVLKSEIYERKQKGQHPLYRISIVANEKGGTYAHVEQGSDIQANASGALTRFETLPDTLRDKASLPVNKRAQKLWEEINNEQAKAGQASNQTPQIVERRYVEPPKSSKEQRMQQVEQLKARIEAAPSLDEAVAVKYEEVSNGKIPKDLEYISYDSVRSYILKDAEMVEVQSGGQTLKVPNYRESIEGVVKKLERNARPYNRATDKPSASIAEALEAYKAAPDEGTREAALQSLSNAQLKQVGLDGEYVRYKGAVMRKEAVEALKAGTTPAGGVEANINQATLPRRLDTDPAVNPETGAPLNPADIRRYLASALDIPVRMGVNRKQALGFYRTKPEVIRMKALNDVPTLAHEVGHYLHYVALAETPPSGAGHTGRTGYVTFNKAFDGELMRLGRATSRNSYTEQQVRMEGVAEYTRLWLTDPLKARASAPKFTQHWETDITQRHPEIMEILTTAQKMVTQYIHQPALTKVKGMIRTRPERPTRTFKELARHLYADWIDELAPIRFTFQDLQAYGLDPNLAQKVVDLGINYIGGWKGKVEHSLHHGAINLQGDVVGESLKGILKGANLEDFEAYLVANRARNLQKRGMEAGISREDAQEVIKNLSGEYDQRAQRLYKWQNQQLDLLAESGILSSDGVAQMRKLNEFYVPFYRLYEGLQSGAGSSGSGRGFIDTNNPVRSIKGSDREILRPLESIIKNAYVFRDLAERNYFAKEFIRAIESVQGGGRAADSVVKKMAPVKVKPEELAAMVKQSGILEEVGFNWDNAEESIESFLRSSLGDNVGTLWRAIDSSDPGKGIFKVWKDGKDSYYQTDDSELYRALRLADSADAEIIKRFPFMRLANMATRALRAGATLTVDFMARNPVRDQFSAAVYSKYGYVPFYDAARGAFEFVGKGNLYQQYIKSGARYSDMLAGDRTDLTQELKTVIKDRNALQFALDLANPVKLLENLQKASEVMEQSTRIMEFYRAKKAGAADTEAANAAKDVTLNFSRHGHKGKLVNMFASFTNAALQDVDKFIRSHKEAPGRTAMKGFMWVTMPTVALWMLQKDDEEIKQLPAWRRTYFWNINLKPVTGVDFILSMPKPFLVGQVYGTSVEAALDYAYSRDPKAIERVKTGFSNVLPSVIPDLMRPTLENITDFSFFREQQLTPMGVDKLAPHMQATERTSVSAQLLAKKLSDFGLEFSPIDLDNLVQGHFAGLGKYGVDAVDKMVIWAGAADVPKKPDEGWTRLPGIRAFTQSPFQAGEQVNDFYEASERMESLLTTQRYATQNKLGMPLDDKWWSDNYAALVWYSDRGGYYAQRMRKMGSHMSELNQAISQVRNSNTIEPKEKTLRIKELVQQRDNLAELAIKSYAYPGKSK